MQIKTILTFLRLEASSGSILLLTAIATLVFCNSPWAYLYQNIFENTYSFSVWKFTITKPPLFWINDCLMSLFFLIVGLELKREIVRGELSKVSQVILPGMAALGGMLIPALIYISFNFYDPYLLKGWSIPIATDIAFALGALSLFRSVPIGLKLFLMALAVMDDIGAIIVIAVFYTNHVSLLLILISTIMFLLLLILNYLGVRSLLAYLFLGFLLWICILKSGIHPTLAGVLLAFTIPSDQLANETQPPLKRLEDGLHPWVAFIIMPLFAFANTGISFAGISFSSFTSPLVLGVIIGMFVGKQLGVFSFSWLTIKMKWSRLPKGVSWREMYGVGIICGIGFTMSLFLGTLAFDGNNLLLKELRLSVLLASVLSSVIGAFVLYRAFKRKALHKRVSN